MKNQIVKMVNLRDINSLMEVATGVEPVGAPKFFNNSNILQTNLKDAHRLRTKKEILCLES